MDSMDFMDFGRASQSCECLDEGFVLWKISGNGEQALLCGAGGMIVHVLMLEGEMEIGWCGRKHPVAKGCFANFIDGEALEVDRISADAEGYVLIFGASFITSLLKNSPPFPPSYVLKIKMWPVQFISQEASALLLHRIRDIAAIAADTRHRFRTEMLKCGLWMLMMDMADEHIRMEEQQEGSAAGAGRKNILFQQFIRLMLANIRNEHSVQWYADKLCVTPQYLNRVVKGISQKTVYRHIATTLAGAIADELENTDTPIVRIAEEFRFPDQATLTKFFKRQTGQTPTEHRSRAATL